MNKVFLMTILMVANSFFSAFGYSSYADKFIELKKIGKEQKNEWFQFAQKHEYQKYDIMARHKAEWFDYGIENIKSWENSDLSVQGKNALFKKQIENALKINENQGKEWKSFYDDYNKNGNEIYKKHLDRMATFKNSLSIQR